MTEDGKLSGGVLTASSQIRRHVYMLISSADESSLEKPLTTERELCELFHVARGTVRKAIDLLVKERLLIRRPHYGTFINPEVLHRNPKRKVISVVIGSGNYTWYDPFAMSSLCGIYRQCILHNVYLHPVEFWENPERTLEMELKTPNTGIIWLWGPERYQHLYEMIEDAEIPLVHITPLFENAPGGRILIDGESYGYGMAQRMIAAGYPDTLYLDDSASVYYGSREAGIRKAYREAGVPYRNNYHFVQVGEINDQAIKLLASGKFRAINSTGRLLENLPASLAHIKKIIPISYMPEISQQLPRPIEPLYESSKTAFDMLLSGNLREQIVQMGFTPFESRPLQKNMGKRKNHQNL